MRANKYLIFSIASATIILSGCSGHADTPAFTTSSDRDSGYTPKTFSSQHETENEEADSLSEEIEEGMDSVREQAQDISEKNEEMDLDKEMENAQDLAEDFVAQ